jgi:hypothetical protein
MFTRKLSSVLFGLGLLSVSAASAGCGGMAPGDYIIYKVSASQPTQSASCYFPLEGPPPNDKSDSETGRYNALVTLTAGPDDAFYLDVGDVGELIGITNVTTIAGVATDDGYTFNQKNVNVEYAGPNGGDVTKARYTTTDVVDVVVTVDGNSISGTATWSHSEKCSNSADCAATPPKPTCKTTTSFAGSELQDVELQHEVK